MQADVLPLPTAERVRAHVLAALKRYWPKDSTPLSRLLVSQRTATGPISGPLRLVEIKLPEWALGCGVNGCLLVPKETVQKPQEMDAWQLTDWWLAAFLLLESWHERVWECQHGPIHSYSFRLQGWDERAWQYAWVNRIGLFLRQRAIRESNLDPLNHLGPMPKPKIHMTHDVDAVSKTIPIRLKQGAFSLFNAGRNLRHGQFRQSAEKLRHAGRFLIGQEDWWAFEQLQKWEAEAGIRATYHFHADPHPKTLKRWLFDPSYDIAASKQQALLRQLTEQGHTIGLHPGFETWQDPTQLAAQRAWAEQVAGGQVTHCRQHWLRFSWQATWAAQQSAGFLHDTTLMFNDRPGFRNSSALSWRPWHASALDLTATPSVFMDSHFYDYQPMSPAARQSAMRHWIQECHSVSGEVAVLWHPHTLTKDYGWADGFREALRLMKDESIRVDVRAC
jgi:hypothetical protein